MASFAGAEGVGIEPVRVVGAPVARVPTRVLVVLVVLVAGVVGVGAGAVMCLPSEAAARRVLGVGPACHVLAQP